MGDALPILYAFHKFRISIVSNKRPALLRVLYGVIRNFTILSLDQ